jgi:16S rRNA (cytosine967-C5)-methyltransferase
MAHTLLLQGGGEVSVLPGFAEGWWSVQDPAAQMVGMLAAPAKGETVLELCAAPGGKTTHLAEMMAGEGTVIAVEVQERKLSLIRAACERLRLSCVAPRAADATDAAALLALLQEQGREAADSIVLDAPCSGFGTLRRNPEHRSQGASHLAGLQALQGRLLEAAATRLKPGGSLTYSVCTPLVGECELRLPPAALVAVKGGGATPTSSSEHLVARAVEATVGANIHRNGP